MRVAVAGVNGIRKHHAKWYHLADEEVGEDFMSLHITQFMYCVKNPTLAPLVPGEIRARNLELQRQILQHI